jgi:hypothetical protein
VVKFIFFDINYYFPKSAKKLFDKENNQFKVRNIKDMLMDSSFHIDYLVSPANSHGYMDGVLSGEECSKQMYAAYLDYNKSTFDMPEVKVLRDDENAYLLDRMSTVQKDKYCNANIPYLRDYLIKNHQSTQLIDEMLPLF